MDWILFSVVSAGWIVGFILLGRIVNWLERRATWWFHCLENGNYLKMNEGAQERFHWEDEEKK